MMNQSNLEDLLRSALEECDRLRAENAHLRMMLGIPGLTSAEPSQTIIPIEVGAESSNAGPPAPEKKSALFRSLFRGREDVYAVRWEGRNGKSGYSPAGAMDWRAIHVARPEDRKKTEDANASTAHRERDSQSPHCMAAGAHDQSLWFKTIGHL
jgi:hypothetical protein